MSGINERVAKIIERVAVSKAEFSQKTGISPVVLSHIGSGRNKVSLSAVQQILEAYAQINPEYLILGKGSMFRINDTAEKMEQITAAVEQVSLLSEQHQKNMREKLSKIIELIDSFT